jgi:hypothetical protein
VAVVKGIVFPAGASKRRTIKTQGMWTKRGEQTKNSQDTGHVNKKGQANEEQSRHRACKQKSPCPTVPSHQALKACTCCLQQSMYICSYDQSLNSMYTQSRPVSLKYTCSCTKSHCTTHASRHTRHLSGLNNTLTHKSNNHAQGIDITSHAY